MDNISKAVYGLKHMKMTNATSDGTYPNFTTAPVFNVRFISDGSFTFSDEAPETTDIVIEDSKKPLLSPETGLGSEGFTLETYDMSEDAYKYLKGYQTVAASESDNPNAGWTISTPGFTLPAQAVEIETEAIEQFPGKLYQWAKMKVTVVKAGSIGRGGLPNFTLTFTQLANTDANGNEISGDRNKEITPAPASAPTSYSSESSI